MTDESTVLGRIIVSPKAIATIASQTALQSYGVVGMASKNIVNGITQALVRDPRHGVQVSTSDDQITIDLYIIIEYQTRISSVAA
ncbi:MAG: Asp23/Gls24 family envelope stress response protein, partial [Chloroflexota bacterium]|nr:Asp23/Gls24 family envelope stress response protein [Chloroflexota bacterium]